MPPPNISLKSRIFTTNATAIIPDVRETGAMINAATVISPIEIRYINTLVLSLTRHHLKSIAAMNKAASPVLRPAILRTVLFFLSNPVLETMDIVKKSLFKKAGR